jgi:hypothetical protein
VCVDDFMISNEMMSFVCTVGYRNFSFVCSVVQNSYTNQEHFKYTLFDLAFVNKIGYLSNRLSDSFP